MVFAIQQIVSTFSDVNADLPPTFSTARRLVRACAGAIACVLVSVSLSTFGAEGAEGTTAVASRVSKDYVRVKLSDGSFAPEAYAFGKGGHWAGAVSDDTIDKMDFMDIARTIAGPLAAQNYVPDKDPKKTKLLIMLYWGPTTVPEPTNTSAAYTNYALAVNEANTLTASGGYAAVNAADGIMSAALGELNFEDNRRDQIDYKNAVMLGYNSPDGEELIGTATGRQMQFTALRHAHNDLQNEIERERYFVVLMAYDFQLAWKEKKHKLLWETRFSVNQPRNDFGKALPLMARSASKYFGQQSHGLIREFIPEGHVELKEPTLIELVEPKK